ncbi:MAG TPA: bifunctional UDP-N-acetylglucosamine diphosphorylase/glucosamine-1-phosphate N-acetyltransferase GlmU [Thermoclostridium caenicola]|uniref:bifunctional UDP-N-acetylglucosamine diphosphorylase/glucosamine-1-phosphate N-acetyltransferase GlmU n=1 Tax=Thermoclostridium caenicola TaxID=659425 RepID=UPI002CD29E90|nr:bifunctional UDP-N-acetylglucosamine diphosphorylase/glucosamine-1-phosphate N-acetyltransferase GlmU [Thermoclostridium caenicola]HOK42480.1 bifunctional UDP-N-acetylglucosamine diphosphorylase/glucosamine-1-phosphate N-acetyltransferase GlmU [Thermoclostridium caenicola]HOL84379.1 bifunctional UDP-N-acetylglucosamine diphosphorylase/glucosamine-1-phosphate N-acetyltransferase GlmU [Thermoclostridium caenicola]HOP71689.1 bifunctional UDP-N-acetylglucosamine diphosphorylase/glucosamine-1-phos
MRDLVTVILAAGAGTRMKSHTAKVLHKICGQPMLAYVMDAARKAGSGEIIAVLGHQAEQVKEAVKDVAFVLQEQQLGTGHAVMQARPLLEGKSGTVLVLYGDTPLITGDTLKQAYEVHLESKNRVTVITARVQDPTGYGRIVRDGDGRIRAIVEHKDATEEQRAIQEINSGMYFFEIPALLKALDRLNNANSQGEYYLTDTIEIILSDNGSAGAYLIGDSTEILGINDRIQLAEAERIMHDRIVQTHMKNGVTFILPETSVIAPQVEIGRDTVIYPGTILEGSTRIGEQCVIGPYSRIVDSTIGNDVHVMNSVILESEIRAKTKVGPFAYLRPGSKIGCNVKIGDFVEVKKSEIGDNTKVSHLTYIGDAQIGRNVNLGCGVVVVNYDGVKKHKTVVGDYAFVGCNVNLVSPVEVKEHAYIAAGSTITEEVPAYSLAIARSRQTIISDWVKRKGLDKK